MLHIHQCTLNACIHLKLLFYWLLLTILQHNIAYFLCVSHCTASKCHSRKTSKIVTVYPLRNVIHLVTGNEQFLKTLRESLCWEVTDTFSNFTMLFFEFLIEVIFQLDFTNQILNQFIFLTPYFFEMSQYVLPNLVIQFL